MLFYIFAEITAVYPRKRPTLREYSTKSNQLVHSIKYEYCPRSFLNMFIRNNVENANYDLRYPNDFVVPRARIELFKKIPAYTLPTEWNNCEDLRFYSNPTTVNITLCEKLYSKLFLDINLTSE
jgi:hypothetical protein